MFNRRYKKRYVIIRDDDICFFTNPRELELVHRPLLEDNKPVNLAVIPMVDTLLDEPFVKAHMPDVRYANIEWNEDLVEFIKQHNFEVLQHGFTHELFSREPFTPEFRITDRMELYRRATQGQRILEKVFGKKPRFFVPPWDVLSKQAYSVLMQLFDGVSIATLSHGRFKKRPLTLVQNFIPWNVPSRFLPRFLSTRIKRQNYCVINGFLILENRGLYVKPEFDMEFLLKVINRFDFVTIVVHYWLLTSSNEAVKMWHNILDLLLANDDTYITTFSEVYKTICRKTTLV